MIHYVYKIINLKNQLYYIGSRTFPIPEEDQYMGSSKIMNNLYNIIGKDNFKKEILFKFNTRKEANIKEDELIKNALQTEPNKIYNIKRSGCKANNDNIFNKRNDLWVDFYETIRNEYKSGINIPQLSKKYKCSTLPIHEIVYDLKFKNKWSRAWENQNLIITEYNEGYSRKFLSKKYKCDINTITSILKKNQIKIRSNEEQLIQNKNKGILQGKKKNVDLILLKEYYLEQNLTLKKTASKLNIGMDALKRIIIENNIPIKSYMWSNKQNRHPAWEYKKEIKKDLQNMSKKDILKKYNIKDYITLNKILI
jgi:hypothetical protein